MEQFRFIDWQVYRDAKKCFAGVLVLVRKLPREYRFELGSQVVRSSFSIVLNIAEGSGKESDRELNRFLEIALGSAYETLASLDVFHDHGFISDDEFRVVQEQLSAISRQLGGLKKSIKTNN